MELACESSKGAYWHACFCAEVCMPGQCACKVAIFANLG